MDKQMEINGVAHTETHSEASLKAHSEAYSEAYSEASLKAHSEAQPDKYQQAISRLLHIMDELRAKCPWDRKQTMESLRCNTIEETYELAEAILDSNMDDIRKELGDLLLHVVFYAKIASEKQAFDFADVCNSLCDKLIKRHPHVFGETQVHSDAEIHSNWEKIKLTEGRKSVLQGIPNSLPALVKCVRLQEKAQGIGFDWSEKEGGWDKLKEEIGEFEAELKNGNTENREEEFGDLLFALVKCARNYGIQPENALEKTNRKFKDRFQTMEELVRTDEKQLKEMSLSEMEIYYKKAKAILNKNQ